MPIIDTVGDLAVMEIERISPLLGKMLGAALGGSIGLGGFKYFEPPRLGKGFNRGRESARNAGIASGRAIAGGNVERVRQTKSGSISQDATGTYRQYKKYRPVQHPNRNRKCGCHTTRSRC